MRFDVKEIFPDFILADKNGYAMAKAIEAAMRYALSVVQTGLDTLHNVEKMPEWRLDEMARELGCLYDFSADVEAKRHWIRDAGELFSAHGTPQAICNYLQGYFSEVSVEENWMYGGEPFHFRVLVNGNIDGEKANWVKRAVSTAKNVRSVMDGMSMGATGVIQIHGDGAITAYAPILRCGEARAGEWPEREGG